MTDKEFLQWIYARLELFGDDPTMDFMHRLRNIINDFPNTEKAYLEGKKYERQRIANVLGLGDLK